MHQRKAKPDMFAFFDTNSTNVRDESMWFLIHVVLVLSSQSYGGTPPISLAILRNEQHNIGYMISHQVGLTGATGRRAPIFTACDARATLGTFALVARMTDGLDTVDELGLTLAHRICGYQPSNDYDRSLVLSPPRWEEQTIKLKWLLNRRPEQGKSRSKGGETPYHEAVYFGRLPLMKVLEDERDDDPKEVIASNTMAVLRHMIQDRNISPNTVGENGSTTLQMVCGGWAEETILDGLQFLLEAGAKPSGTGKLDPVFLLIINSDLPDDITTKAIQTLAKAGHELRTERIWNTVNFAIMTDRPKTCEYLLKHGVRPTSAGKGTGAYQALENVKNDPRWTRLRVQMLAMLDRAGRGH
jgi:hypothetical protein